MDFLDQKELPALGEALEPREPKAQRVRKVQRGQRGQLEPPEQLDQPETKAGLGNKGLRVNKEIRETQGLLVQRGKRVAPERMKDIPKDIMTGF